MHLPRFIFIFSICLFPLLGFSQFINGVETRWSDAFTEWIIYTEDENLQGELTLRWQLNIDWTEWDYRLGDEFGSIKLKFKGNPSQWELRGGNEIITVSMVWPNDIREWRVTNNTTTLTIQSRWGNNLNEWRLKNENHGRFDMITNWENDPRQWNIQDDLYEDISIHMKIAMLFIVTFHSLPKG